MKTLNSNFKESDETLDSVNSDDLDVSSKNVRIMDSIAILDGFKSVLMQYSDKLNQIKTEIYNRNKEIDGKRKNKDIELAEMLKSIESDNVDSTNSALKEEETNRSKYDQAQRDIDSELANLSADYSNKVRDAESIAEAQEKQIDRSISLVESTIHVFADFFGCNYVYDKNKSEILNNFSKQLKPVFAISDYGDIYWYKKYKFVFGESKVEYLHDSFTRIGAAVEDDLYDEFRKTGEINETGIVKSVQMIFKEVRAANEYDKKKRLRMPDEQRKHIENAVYIYVQMICALKKYKEQRDFVFEQIRKQRDKTIMELQSEKRNKAQEIDGRRTTYISHLEDKLNKIKGEYASNCEQYRQMEEEYAREISNDKLESNRKAQADRDNAVTELAEELKIYFDKCLDGVTIGLNETPISIKEFMMLSSSFESRDNDDFYKIPTEYCTFICLGSIRFDYAKESSFRCHPQLINVTRDFLRDYFSGVSGPLFSLGDNGWLSIPYVVDFTFFKGMCFDYPSDKYDFAKQSCRSLMFHMLTDTRASSIYYTMVDSKLPGGFFSVFNSFKGVDARTVAILNNNKIFNNELDISEVLQKHCDSLGHDISSFAYSNIVKCNRLNIKKRPINVIFITDLSNNALLHSSYENIKTLVSGTKLGYSCIFMRANNSEKGGIGLSSLKFQGTILEYIDGYKFQVQGTPYSIAFLPLPESNIISWAGKCVSDGFKSWHCDVINFLKVVKPISKIEEAYDGVFVDGCMFDENNTCVNYVLNDLYLNGLIMGNPGLGKTRFIHAIIAGIMSKYSPDSVRINILDFKQNSLGVRSYSKNNLPHIGVISNITNRVLGLNFLKYIDEQMNKRTGDFNSSEINVDKYSAYMPWCREQQRLGRNVNSFPREIIIIDEIQELLDKDDDISHECTDIIKRILRLGRASGVHLIISTQWLSNLDKTLDVELINRGIQSKVLFNTDKGYGKLAVDPKVMSSVNDVGQALYILGGIHTVVNVALIDGNDETKYLEKIANTYQLSNTACNTIFLRKRISDGVTSELVRFYSGEEIDFSDLPVIVGESADFKEPFILKPKGDDAMKFMMISSREDQESKHSVAATILLCLLAKIRRSKIQRNALILFADFANDCEIVYKTLLKALPEECDLLKYFDCFGAVNGVKNELRKLENTDTDIFLFVYDVGEGLKDPDFKNLLAIIKDEIRVNLFVFGDSAEQLSEFEEDSNFRRSDFFRAIYCGGDNDYSYMVGNTTELKAKNGQVLLCRGFDSETHEVVPFDYKDNKEWVKNFVKKLFIS